MRKFKQINLFRILLFILSWHLISCSALKVGNSKNPSKQIISEARTYLGVPYKWGGMSRQGVDCSGLVYRSFEKIGVTVPRTTEGLKDFGKKISIKKARPGDLLFFALSEKRDKISHVGIVTEKIPGKLPSFIHASSSRGVVESSLDIRYYKDGFKQARRLLE